MSLLKSRPSFSCDANCGYKFSIRKGTFLENSRLALSIWFKAVVLLSADFSLSVLSLSEALEVQRDSVKRIKEAVKPYILKLQEAHRCGVLGLSNAAENDANLLLIRAVLSSSEREELNYYAFNSRYKLICASAYEMLPKLPDSSVDLICTDPPYEHKLTEWDVAVNYKELAVEFSRIVKDTGAVVVFCAMRQISDYIKAFSSQFPCSQQYIFIKSDPDNIGLFYNRFMPNCENALLFFKSSDHAFNAVTPLEKRNYFCCPRASVKERADYGHRTQKPVALMKHLIKMLSNTDDFVLDAFCGTGTTGVAAVELGRRFLGIEIDPQYCAVSSERLKSAYKKKINRKRIDIIGVV